MLGFLGICVFMLIATIWFALLITIGPDGGIGGNIVLLLVSIVVVMGICGLAFLVAMVARIGWTQGATALGV